MISLLNDYTGQLDPHVASKICSENTLSYLGSVAMIRNSILIYLLFNLMPDTGSES